MNDNIDHLTDWQIEALLIDPLETTEDGLSNAAQGQGRLHLQSCPACNSRREQLAEALLLYREAVILKTNDATKHASTYSITKEESHSFSAYHLFWGWRAQVLALLLLLVVLIPAFVAHERERREAQLSARNHVVQEEAKDVKDDLLLQQVDQEITESVPQPMQSLTQPLVESGSKDD